MPRRAPTPPWCCGTIRSAGWGASRPIVRTGRGSLDAASLGAGRVRVERMFPAPIRDPPLDRLRAGRRFIRSAYIPGAHVRRRARGGAERVLRRASPRRYLAATWRCCAVGSDREAPGRGRRRPEVEAMTARLVSKYACGRRRRRGRRDGRHRRVSAGGPSSNRRSPDPGGVWRAPRWGSTRTRPDAEGSPP